MGKTTTIAVTEKSVAAYVISVLPNLKNYAVRKYDVELWAKTVMLCIVETPSLMECLQTEVGRISMYHALRFAAATGLTLNPQEGKACLVPIGGKVKYWIEKGGMIDLVLDTGAVKYIRANAVRQHDTFEPTETLDGDSYRFSPATKSRGDIIGFYAAIKLMDGKGLVHYMTREEVDAHRDQYGKGLDKEDSAWRKSYEGMGIKTVIKMAIKRLALPKEAEKIIDAAQDGAAGDDEPIPVSFQEIPGTTAEEVEANLAGKKTENGKKTEAPMDQKLPRGQTAVAPAGASAAKAPAKEGELQIF
jgi:phage RecT family recombinase